MSKRFLSFLCVSMMLLTSCSQPSTPSVNATEEIHVAVTDAINSPQPTVTATATETEQPVLVQPIKASFTTSTTDEKPFDGQFVAGEMRCFFNEHEIVAAASGEPSKNGSFAWQDLNGKPVLMVLVDGELDNADKRNELMLPVFGNPFIGASETDYNIIWCDPDDPSDGIALVFKSDSKELWVPQNTRKGVTGDSDDYTVELAVKTVGDGSTNHLYVPLYAILNETGGGVLHDPIGNGTNFIYSGDSITGYTGIWETKADSANSQEVSIAGKTYSVASSLTILSLMPDGTFSESERKCENAGQWNLIEKKGKYSFFGRILIFDYKTESEYSGSDYSALTPIKVDEPIVASTDSVAAGSSGSFNIAVRYVEQWSQDTLTMRDSKPLYAVNINDSNAAPLPGKLDKPRL